MGNSNSLQRIVVLGTYDKSKPRTRILLRGLRENNIEVIECYYNVWGGVEDKSQVKGLWNKLIIIFKFIIAYPVLIWKYMQLPKHDVVLIGYLGLFDVLVLWPFIRFRGAILIWDIFISLYNTVVEDRKLITKYNIASLTLWLMEWFALKTVDLALMDTQAHADYICKTYHCDPKKVQRVFVGVEPERFNLSSQNSSIIPLKIKPKKILFYGQFIPLHGIETIIEAAKLTENNDIEWLIIGKGQEEGKIKSLIDDLKPSNLQWIEWVQYEELIKYLSECHIALGIFGSTDKAQRVIPNKVFQILMAGRPLITADTPAIRELVENENGIRLIPVASSEALAEAVCIFPEEKINDDYKNKLEHIRHIISPETIGKQLISNISNILFNRKLN